MGVIGMLARHSFLTKNAEKEGKAQDSEVLCSLSGSDVVLLVYYQVFFKSCYFCLKPYSI